MRDIFKRFRGGSSGGDETPKPVAPVASEVDLQAVDDFLSRHVAALKERLSAGLKLGDAKWLFSILTDKDGTIFKVEKERGVFIGENAEMLSAFLHDAVEAGIDVQIISTDPDGWKLLTNNVLIKILCERDPNVKALTKGANTSLVLSRNDVGMVFDDSITFRRIAENCNVVAVIDPNSDTMTAFLSSWGRLNAEQKAAAFKPWLALKAATLSAKPGEPRAEPA